MRYLGEMANHVDALEAAVREALEYPADGPDAKPNLLVLRSHIGWPAPKLTDTAAAHGTPFGEEEIKTTKAILGLPPDETFWVPDEVRDFYGHEIARGAQERAAWEARFAAWDGDRAAWDAAQAGHGLPGWADDLPSFEPGTMLATRHAINQCLDASSARLPGLIAGSADLTGNNGVKVKGAQAMEANTPGGIQVHYGIREHGMGAASERHGPTRRDTPGRRDLLRVLRLHAPSRAPRRADGLACRVLLVPRLRRPGPGRADPPTDRAPRLAPGHARPRPHPARRRQRDRAGLEVGGRGRGPGRAVADPPGCPRPGGDGGQAAPAGVARGAYVLSEPAGSLQIVLVASGSEVQLCVAAAEALAASGVRARVVSFPSWDIFEKQPEDYRTHVFPPFVPVLSVEAGSTFGWDRYADDAIGIDHFGASAPGEVVMERFGFTAGHVAERAQALLARHGG